MKPTRIGAPDEMSAYDGEVLVKATGRVSRISRVTAVLALVLVALACLADVVQPTMAAGASPHCFGAACPDQIGCAPTAPPSASSTSLAHPITLALVGAAPDLVFTPVAASVVSLSTMSSYQGLIAPSAPRSPPLA